MERGVVIGYERLNTLTREFVLGIEALPRLLYINFTIQNRRASSVVREIRVRQKDAQL
jgi:hypothetical protein